MFQHPGRIPTWMIMCSRPVLHTAMAPVAQISAGRTQKSGAFGLHTIELTEGNQTDLFFRGRFEKNCRALIRPSTISTTGSALTPSCRAAQTARCQRAYPTFSTETPVAGSTNFMQKSEPDKKSMLSLPLPRLPPPAKKRAYHTPTAS